MKVSKYIENLFQKYINNTLTNSEFNTLLEFFKNPESKESIKEMFDKYWEDLDISERGNKKNIEYESDILYSHILTQIEGNDKKKRFNKSTVKYIFKIAASLIIILGSTTYYFYQSGYFSKNKVVSSPIDIDPNAITLTLSDGNIKVVSENEEENILDYQGNVIGTQKGGQISYSNITNKTKKPEEELVYNELTVPYGKFFDLELSDGTLIKLNAGTSIKYPVKFIKGLERKVFLQGEAYFEVAKDKAHPFIVNTNDINVEVLGTAFNMSYYPEDTHINTVLVEGSVKLYKNVKLNELPTETFLTPGYKAAWNKTDKQMTVKKVDTQLYTAWKDGVLLFKKASYQNIVKKLERRYDVTIENRYPFLDTQVYTATFSSKEETIEDVLDAFKEDIPFIYTRTNNKIIIIKPL